MVRIGSPIIYCLGAADIAPGLRLRQTEFAGVITAVHNDGSVDLTYFPPAETGLGNVVQAARVQRQDDVPVGRSYWRVEI